MKNVTLLALALLAGCGGDDGGGGGGGVDAAVTTPITVNISGTASEIGLGGRTPKPGVSITAFKVSDDSQIATTTTDGSGNFTISAMGEGSVNAYLKASLNTYLDTYLYPPGPLSSDFANVPVLLLTSGTRMTANSIAGASDPDPAKGWIGMIVDDATTTAVAGATVSSTPSGEVHYNGSAGVPQGQATSTSADGIGYVMNVAAGDVMVSASKSGTTFKSHTIKARANVITLTLITP